MYIVHYYAGNGTADINFYVNGQNIVNQSGVVFTNTDFGIQGVGTGLNKDNDNIWIYQGMPRTAYETTMARPLATSLSADNNTLLMTGGGISDHNASTLNVNYTVSKDGSQVASGSVVINNYDNMNFANYTITNNGNYTVNYIVDDGENISSVVTSNIVERVAAETPPTPADVLTLVSTSASINAANTTFTLYANATNNDGGTVTYHYSPFTGEPQNTISGAFTGTPNTTASTTFAANGNGTYQWHVYATDDVNTTANQSTNSITIAVHAPPPPPPPSPVGTHDSQALTIAISMLALGILIAMLTQFLPAEYKVFAYYLIALIALILIVALLTALT